MSLQDLKNRFSGKVAAIGLVGATAFGAAGSALAGDAQAQKVDYTPPPTLTTHQQVVDFSKQACSSRTGEFAAVVLYEGHENDSTMRVFQSAYADTDSVQIIPVESDGALHGGNKIETYLCGHRGAISYARAYDVGDAFDYATDGLDALRSYFEFSVGIRTIQSRADEASYVGAMNSLRTNYPTVNVVDRRLSAGEGGETAPNSDAGATNNSPESPTPSQ